jgi:hypothetical protein
MPEILAGIHRRIEQELALLTAVGLPLPAQLLPAPGQSLTWDTEYETYEYTVPLSAIKIQNPQFSIPTFHYYVARQKQNEPPLYYLIPNTGTSQRDELNHAYEHSSMVEFLSSFPGRWFNRDPYGYFYECNKEKFRGWSPAYILNRQRPEVTAAPLQEVSGFSRDDLSRMERALTLYRGLSNNIVPSLPRVLGGLNWNVKIHAFPDYGVSELLTLNIPQPTLPAKQATLKVIPPPVTKQSVMRELFHNLPPLEHPFSFDLVDTGSAVTYQIACSLEDREQIIRQLQLALPQCTVIEQGAPDPAPMLHSLTLTLPQYALAATSDTKTDPLTQVFDLLESNTAGEHVAVQFICWPFPSAIANTFI